MAQPPKSKAHDIYQVIRPTTQYTPDSFSTGDGNEYIITRQTKKRAGDEYVDSFTLLEKRNPLCEVRSKNTLEQTLKIVFVLKFDFDLILAVDGFHLNRRI